MNILLVDDEQLALDDIVAGVKKASPESVLHPFGNPQMALDFLRSDGKIDVAFLDVEMFGMDGITLAKLMKDICPDINIIFVTGFSEYAVEAINMRASGYLLKPVSTEDIRRELSNLRFRHIEKKHKSRIVIQTFGNFEIFADGQPIVFAREKSKELLAYIVDRNGAAITTAEAAGILWENKEFTRSVANQLQVIVSSLRKSLRDVNAEDILIKSRNRISIDKTKVDCDYYNFLLGDASSINSYLGEYMVNYAWAEMTTGYIEQKMQSK